MQFEELSARMRPARCFPDPAGFIQPLETRKTIDLQNAAVVLQMI